MSSLGLAQWIELLLHFLLLSVLAVGGGIVVAPEIHRVMVSEMGLLDDAQFNASIAIAQAAPGPNVLFVAVMGFQAAGLLGAATTLLGMMLPSSTLSLAAARWGHARSDWRAVQAFKVGMAPITIALLLSTGWILNTQAPSAGSIGLAVAAAVLVWRTRIHLLSLIAAGGIVGALGWT
jgi:chromate transporter